MRKGWRLFFIVLFCIYLIGCFSSPASIPPETSEPSEGSSDIRIAADSKKKEYPDEKIRTGESEAAPPPAAAEPAESAEDKHRGKEVSGLYDAAAATKRVPSVSGLRAGYADDNKQFNYFIKFLKTYADRVDHLPLNVEERIVIKVQDINGKSLPNAGITIFDNKKILCRGTSYADGRFLFFPSEYSANIREFRAVITYNQHSMEMMIERSGKREVKVPFDFPRYEQQAVPLDILFILDTTGSMGEEIQRLKATIEIINLNLSSLSYKPELRFGMVLYKDEGDEYVTKVIHLTDNLKRFQRALNLVEASGGGDTPEDLQAALKTAMTGLDWNRKGIRLSFVITDAPPHLDYGQEYSYVHAAADAQKQGIKIFSVGTGGLDLMGEYILRQISQYTAAKYIFLTYGEQGESEGGEPGSVSHHTGAQYQTDKLEAIIIRIAKEELSFVTDQPIEEPEDYFLAHKLDDEEQEETLNKLFQMAISQLIDYSTFRIPKDSPAAVLPISPVSAGYGGTDLGATAEYFTEQLIFSFSRGDISQKTFRILERKDLQRILEELELQLGGLVEESNAARVGALLGADILIIGKLYSKSDSYELFIKLLRVETGEILSITKAIIDRKLGI